MNRRIELAQALLEVLQEAHKLRSERPGYTAADYSLPCWALYEQEQMLAAVNARRKTPVTLCHIQMVEQGAIGHCDYARKFALYCADLVLEDPK